MNKVILMGRLVADPELRQTQNGISSCRFRIAVNRRFANKQTGEREADFISCVAWRQTAESINRYFKKGSMICVEGELRQSNYPDKSNPSITHYSYEVLVDSFEFTGSKAESGTSGGYNNNYSVPQGNYNPPQNNNYNNYPAQNDYMNNNSNNAVKSEVPENNSMSYGDMNDYEEILSDGDLPF